MDRAVASSNSDNQTENGQENYPDIEQGPKMYHSVTHIGVVNGPLHIGPQFNNFFQGGQQNVSSCVSLKLCSSCYVTIELCFL